VPPPPIPLGPVPLNPKGPEPQGFARFPGVTSVDVVHAQLKRGARMALLDARAPSDYANEHIAGAVSVPFYDPSPYLKHLPKNAWLVSYCACPHAESKTLAQKLTDAGFTKVTVLNEGLGVWKARGYPVHTLIGSVAAAHGPRARTRFVAASWLRCRGPRISINGAGRNLHHQV
jgi:cytochrome c oxidase cbb3-type subunit III